mmetsp:Transcript_94712/g.273876  ORF Transcript_94712/g.273876 Transcript_94712/m.273876 type:complete len:434 (+) Transcript_94712:321-1622(+)
MRQWSVGPRGAAAERRRWWILRRERGLCGHGSGRGLVVQRRAAGGQEQLVLEVLGLGPGCACGRLLGMGFQRREDDIVEGRGLGHGPVVVRAAEVVVHRQHGAHPALGGAEFEVPRLGRGFPDHVVGARRHGDGLPIDARHGRHMGRGRCPGLRGGCGRGVQGQGRQRRARARRGPHPHTLRRKELRVPCRRGPLLGEAHGRVVCRRLAVQRSVRGGQALGVQPAGDESRHRVLRRRRADGMGVVLPALRSGRQCRRCRRHVLLQLREWQAGVRQRRNLDPGPQGSHALRGVGYERLVRLAVGAQRESRHGYGHAWDGWLFLGRRCCGLAPGAIGRHGRQGSCRHGSHPGLPESGSGHQLPRWLQLQRLALRHDGCERRARRFNAQLGSCWRGVVEERPPAHEYLSKWRRERALRAPPASAAGADCCRCGVCL